MSKPVILTCALTGGAALSGKNPAIPVTPAEIARQAVDAAKAGATIAHIHVRDPESGAPSMRLELYEEVVDRIRQAGCSILINLTTGPGARFIPGRDEPRIGDPTSTLALWPKRVEHIEALRPDICSLDVGSMNFGQHVFINTPADLAKMAEAIRRAGVKPEMETFELGHVRLAKHLIEQGLIDAPPLFQICLGIPWGAPATPEVMMAMRDALPEGAEWAAFGIGATQFPMVAQAVLLGGHVRVGLEDNLYLRRGVLAPHNAALVERAVAIIEHLDRKVATPEDAREILRLVSRPDGHAAPAAGG